MKWLVGAACVAILASSAVYLTDQYNAHVERQAIERARVTAMALEAIAKGNKTRAMEKFAAQANLEDDLKHVTADECAEYARQIVYQKTVGQDLDKEYLRRLPICIEAGRIEADDIADLKKANVQFATN